MGIFDRLFGGRFTLRPPDETNVSDAAIMRELRPSSPEQKHALKAPSESLLASVPDHESSRLVRRILRKFAMGEDAYIAFSDGLLNDIRGQKLEYLVLLSVDWKSYDGFEYLAPYLVKASGVNESYTYVHDGALTMPEVLTDFNRWLVPFGKRYLHFDSVGDC